MAKKKPRRDPAREERITMEVVVDCYNREEVAMGWSVVCSPFLGPREMGIPQFVDL